LQFNRKGKDIPYFEVLMEETDESKFKKIIDKVVVEMKENVATKIFGEYFEKNCRAVGNML